jgi:hypothetical protein
MSAQLRQSMLSFHQSGRIKTNRPGPKPKALTTLITTASNTLIFGQKRRRKIRGVNERQVIKVFRSSRKHQAIEEPDSNNSKFYNSDGDHRSRPKLKRNTYSREKMLLAVIYYKLTDILGKKEGDPIILIFLRLVLSNLKIDRHCLREWKKQNQKIL